jgi:hypothetical protein
MIQRNIFMGKPIRYNVPNWNTHVHELLTILLTFEYAFGFIMKYCKMYVKILIYQTGLLRTSSNKLVWHYYTYLQFYTYLHYLHLCSVIVLEVCDKCRNKVLDKVKHYSHCICILYCFCHSFFMHTSHLLLACFLVHVGGLTSKNASLRIYQ